MNHVTKNKLLSIAAISLVLSACTKEKTHTVREFLHDPELLKTMLAFCNNNPGERQIFPNCINASQAFSTKSDMLNVSKWHRCFKDENEKDIVDHACIDAYLDKWKKK